MRRSSLCVGDQSFVLGVSFRFIAPITPDHSKSLQGPAVRDGQGQRIRHPSRPTEKTDRLNAWDCWGQVYPGFLI